MAKKKKNTWPVVNSPDTVGNAMWCAALDEPRQHSLRSVFTPLTVTQRKCKINGVRKGKEERLGI